MTHIFVAMFGLWMMTNFFVFLALKRRGEILGPRDPWEDI